MATVPPPATTSDTEAKILGIVRDLLKELGSDDAAQKVTTGSRFEKDLGLGSLERVELLLRVENQLRLRLPDEVAQEADTVRDWAQAIEQGNWGNKGSGRYPIDQPGDAPPPFIDGQSFADIFRRHVERTPDRVQIHLLDQDEGQDLSYAELYRNATETAAGLRVRGLRPNETVAIMLPTCADFFYSFLGVMLAGGIAVPIYPPARPDKIEEYVLRQVKILQNAEVRFLISWDQVRAVTQVMQLRLPSLIDVTSVDRLRSAGRGERLAEAPAAEEFFIQYTSGSTGNPKGVTLTHGNVLANVQGIGWGVQGKPDDVVVSWLPLYHDMGLIGSWLFSFFYAYPITVLSPLDFLTRPERWLWALNDSRGTLCPAPNFSYELCARKIEDEAIEGVDLSCWRVVINAGEPVLPETLERFTKRFAPYGFRPEGWIPCYGLAESSVALTFPPINRLPLIDRIRRDIFDSQGRAEPAEADDQKVLEFVANGKPLPNHEVRIVDDAGKDLPERVQGRLIFRGPSRTQGYYRNPQATQEMIDAEGWMDSGDLGYFANGEVYVTGRKKDLIIKGGHNLVPQEAEMAAADVPGVRRGCVAAFGSRDQAAGTERIVVVAETRATAAAELEKIRSQVVEAVDTRVGLPPDDVRLVAPQVIPKTSSGKIRRNETRLLYEAGKLGASKRPPWLQILRLGLQNLGGWSGLLARSLASGAARAWLVFGERSIGVALGMAARWMPTRISASRVVQTGCRWLLAWREAEVDQGQPKELSDPVLLLSNRASQGDVLAVLASLPGRIMIADKQMLSGLPWSTAFMLEPLVVPAVEEITAPPGGSLGQRIEQTLRTGASVYLSAENRPGTAARLSRFRLDALRGAVQAEAGVWPVYLHGTRVLTDGQSDTNPPARLVLGEPLTAGAEPAVPLMELRQSVRDWLASAER